MRIRNGRRGPWLLLSIYNSGQLIFSEDVQQYRNCIRLTAGVYLACLTTESGTTWNDLSPDEYKVYCKRACIANYLKKRAGAYANEWRNVGWSPRLTEEMRIEETCPEPTLMKLGPHAKVAPAMDQLLIDK